jgi:cytochrome P450
MALTLEVVVATLFGAELKSGTKDIGAALDVVMDYFLGFAGTGIPLPLSIPTPGNARFRRAVKAMDALVYGFIAARRAEGEAAVAERSDLLSMFLSARDEEGRAMDERQLRDEAVTMVLAGHETTALTLSWTTWLLGRHPEVMARVRAEVQAVLGDRPASWEDLARLRYTEQVMQESMRLYPPARILGRETQQPVKVGEIEIPAGVQVYISPWLVQRDPRFFDAPTEFRPERWANDFAKTLPRFAYFPFGGGPRICIGNAFAKMEAVVLLATAVQSSTFEVVPSEQPKLVPSITLRPGAPILARVA